MVRAAVNKAISRLRCGTSTNNAVLHTRMYVQRISVSHLDYTIERVLYSSGSSIGTRRIPSDEAGSERVPAIVLVAQQLESTEYAVEDARDAAPERREP